MKYAILALLTSCAPAYAIECGNPAEVKAELTEKGFQSVFWGDTKTGETVNMLVSPELGWIGIVLTQDGRACVVANGDDWGARAAGIDG
jgi:hypothetical protein